MANANFMMRVGKSSCIRCDFETDEAMSFTAQDAAMMEHLKVAHPKWMTEPLTPEQEARIAELNRTPDQRRIAELEAQLKALTEQVRVLKQNAEDLRDSVLNQRGALAENGMTNDQVNDVLAEIDDAFAARSAAPGKERGR